MESFPLISTAEKEEDVTDEVEPVERHG